MLQPLKIQRSFGNIAAAAVVAAAMLYGGYLRSLNLGPESLFLDDAWVAVLSRSPTIDDFISNGSSSPPLFNAFVTLCIWLLPGPELSAQIFGFVCATLVIAVTAIAAYSVSRNAWAGAVAAILVACHPGAIEQTTRVKQYSSDMLVVAAYVVGFCLLRERPTARLLWACTLVAAVCSFLSTVSLFVVAAFFPIAVMRGYRRNMPRRHVAGAAAVMLATMVVVFFGVLRPGINDALRQYWAPHYLPADSLSGFLSSLQTVLADWVAGCLHGFDAGRRQEWVVAVGTSVVGLGAFSLLLIPGRRSYVAANIVLLLGLLLASASRRFPLGTGRVDLFVVPLIAIFVGVGVTFVGQTKYTSARILWIAAVVAFVLIKLPVRNKYPRTRTKFRRR